MTPTAPCTTTIHKGWAAAAEVSTISHWNMCWWLDGEEQELLRDEAQRAEDERLDVKAACERETDPPERSREDERELIRL